MHYRPYKKQDGEWMFLVAWIALAAICILCAVRSANYSKMIRAEHDRTIHQDSEGEK